MLKTSWNEDGGILFGLLLILETHKHLNKDIDK